MLRKFALLWVVAATLGATAFTPSDASARDGGRGRDHSLSSKSQTTHSPPIIACLECKPRPEKHDRRRHHFSPFFFAGSAYYDNYYNNYDYEYEFVLCTP